MVFVKDVYSTKNPILEDIDSSPTTKYIRENVREVIENDIIMYVYDEYQYTADEFCKLKVKELNTLKSKILNN